MSDQENFFDAVRNDPKMTEEQKQYWLSKEPAKPCPFCGKTPSIHRTGIEPYRVYCANADCQIGGDPVEVFTFTIEMWNTRPVENQLRATLAQWESGELYSQHAARLYWQQQEIVKEAIGNLAYAHAVLLQFANGSHWQKRGMFWVWVGGVSPVSLAQDGLTSSGYREPPKVDEG
jgi:hypothetical protein